MASTKGPMLFLARDQKTMTMVRATQYRDLAGNQMVVQTMAAIVLFVLPTILAAFGDRSISERALTRGIK